MTTTIESFESRARHVWCRIIDAEHGRAFAELFRYLTDCSPEEQQRRIAELRRLRVPLVPWPFTDWMLWKLEEARLGNAR